MLLAVLLVLVRVLVMENGIQVSITHTTSPGFLYAYFLYG
jgi:hypothetical protein